MVHIETAVASHPCENGALMMIVRKQVAHVSRLPDGGLWQNRCFVYQMVIDSPEHQPHYSDLSLQNAAMFIAIFHRLAVARV